MNLSSNLLKINLVKEALTGWSLGYGYSLAKNKENEVKQGKNYYFASIAQTTQCGYLGSLFLKINSALPSHPLKMPVKLLCNIVPIMSLPAFLLCASVKHGNYEFFSAYSKAHLPDQISNFYNFLSNFRDSRNAALSSFGKIAAFTKFNKLNKLIKYIPDTLGHKTTKVMSFVAEHGGDVFKVAMVTGAVGLIALGNTFYGTAVLAALGYQILDQKGYVPRRISLFMERYMPTVAQVGMLISGSILIKGVSLLQLSTLYTPAARFLQHKVDDWVRHYFKLSGPSLREMDAPVQQRREMTHQEIMEILNAGHNAYEIDPAHCGKFLHDFYNLPSNNNFDQFLTFFDQINWEDKYHLVLPPLKEDDRFIDFLFEAGNQEASKEAIQGDVEFYFNAYAAQLNMAPARCAANYLREQMVAFVDGLNGRRRVEGTQEDLNEAIYNFSKFLSYLMMENDPIEREDALLKMAVEGGAYCARAVKRVSREQTDAAIQRGFIRNHNETTLESYERKIMQSLQNIRLNTISEAYQVIASELPKAIGYDVHMFDVYRLYLSLGFYPLSHFERASIGLVELLNWEQFNDVRGAFYSQYQSTFDSSVKEVGEAEFGIYLREMINGNDLLSEEEKGRILDMFTECNDGYWSYDETLERFHRLMFVRLGVLRPNLNPEPMNLGFGEIINIYR